MKKIDKADRKEDNLLNLYDRLIEKNLANIEANDIKMKKAQENIREWQEENNKYREENAELLTRRNAVDDALEGLE